MPKKGIYELEIREKIRLELYRLDWIIILKKAIEARRTSWGEDIIREWRNASDEVLSALMEVAEEARIFLTFEQRVKKNVTVIMSKKEEDILFFAFRYALGRRTAAVDILVTEIKNRWQEFRPHTQEQMQDEIRRYPEMYGSLGDQCDIDSWQEVLDLKISKEL